MKTHTMYKCANFDERSNKKKEEFQPISTAWLACVWQRLSNGVAYFVRHGCKTSAGRHSICYRLVGVFVLIIKPF